MRKHPNIFYAIVLVICFGLLLGNPVFAQSKIGTEKKVTQIEILNSDVLSSKKTNGEELRKLKGNVRLKHESAIMDCDSAYLYSAKNTMEAFGNIHINQGDTINMYGKHLDYNGNTKYAVIKQDVKLTDKQMTLTTDRLDYDMDKKVAYYTNGAVMTDAENRLVSQRGYYHSDTKDMFFRKNVKLTNPQYVMTCDTLQYNIESRKAFFHGPTTILSEKDLIYCENGWYNTLNNTAQFGKKAYLKSNNQILYGDTMFYDRTKGFGRANSNIRVVDTAEHMLIEGQYAEHFQKLKKTFITDRVLVTKGFKTDSVYVTADTIYSIYDSTGKYRIIKGFHNSKVYNKQFQAKADSIIYSFVDSTMDLRFDPVFWLEPYQITAKRIKLVTKNNSIVRSEMYENSFITDPEDKNNHYSQIKGKDMTGYFLKNELYHIDVRGNSESIYYVRDDKKAFIGMNKIESSDIRIQVKERKLKKINFVKEPDATLTPMKDINIKDAFLKGFKWREAEQPKSLDDLRKYSDKPVTKEKPKKDTVKKKKTGTKKKKTSKSKH